MDRKTDVKAAVLENAEAADTKNCDQASDDVSFKMLWQRCLELARQGRQEDLRAMLRRHGVERLTELPEEKYVEVLREVEKW